MGRYDKIRVYNGSSWVQPNNIYMYNGSSWVSFGTNTSTSTKPLYFYNGSSWVRKTLNRQDYTNYNTATEKFVNYTGTSTALSITSGDITGSTRRQVGSTWNVWQRGIFQEPVGQWWSGTIYGRDGQEDWHNYSWAGARWVQYLKYRSPDSGYFRGCPHTCIAQFYSGSWSTGQTYAATKYTARNQWNSGWTFNKQAAYTQLKVSYWNTAAYEEDGVSLRVGRFSLYTGTISSGTNWI